ncbi:MAG: hypothetical protein EKK42_13025 [Pseudonocardiaceae bacterium]|nr:MAG: hypothetical protein EKK42_13025 [Pseudonocardiaceae bacterium]
MTSTQRADHLNPTESARLRHAALRALSTHPGPVGELIHRELMAWQDFGHRIGRDGLPRRLAAEILGRDEP